VSSKRFPHFVKYDPILPSVVVKDLRLKDEDKDEDLKIGPRGQGVSSKTTTPPGEIGMNLNLTGAQWQICHPFVTQSLQYDGA